MRLCVRVQNGWFSFLAAVSGSEQCYDLGHRLCCLSPLFFFFSFSIYKIYMHFCMQCVPLENRDKVLRCVDESSHQYMAFFFFFFFFPQQ